MKTKNTSHIFNGKQNPSQPSLVREGVNFSLKGVSAFTLVELIIVITILAILATIAFISFQNYTKDARDGNRVTTLSTLQKGLELYEIKTGNYPTPDEIYATGIFQNNTNLLTYQGYIGNDVTRLINMNSLPKDPVSENKYVYGISIDKKYYQIATTLENTQANIILPITYADSTSYQAKVVGNYPGGIKKGDSLYNLKSLLFSSEGDQTDITQDYEEETYFITDGNKNLPYKINSTTIMTGGIKEASTSTGVTYLKTNWNTLSGSLEENLGIPLDTIGILVFGEKEYLTNVKEKGSSSSSSGGGETPTTYTITSSVSGANGTVSCTPNPVNQGSNVICTATPSANYTVDTWNGCDSISGNDCTLSNVTANKTISVSFKATGPVFVDQGNGIWKTADGKLTKIMGNGQSTTSSLTYNIMTYNPSVLFSTSTTGWGRGPNDNTIEWGCYGVSVTTTATNGQQNTTNITTNATTCKTGTSNNGTTDIAAKFCSDLNITVDGQTFDDWYLPAGNEGTYGVSTTNNHQYEIGVLRNNRATIGGFGTSYYWSSSQNSTIRSWMLRFSDSYWDYSGKNSAGSVRCVRIAD